MKGFATRPSRLRRWAPGGACILAAALTIPASVANAATVAPPSRRDAASARKLIAAMAGFYETGLRTRRQAVANVNGTIALVKRTCPHVIPAEAFDGSKHQLKVGHQLTLEVTADLWLVFSAPVEPEAIHEADALDDLRFSSVRATRDSRELARSQRLIATVPPSDACADLRAAAANHYEHVPAGTRRIVGRFLGALGSKTPLYVQLAKDLRLTRRDRAAFARMRSLADNYFALMAVVLLRAEPRLASALTGTNVTLERQAGTTTAASTRSTSSSNEIPAASAASGRRLVSVSPGMGLTSSTNSSLVELSSMRSTRAKPAQPSRPYVSSAISPARVATVSSIWAGQTKRVRPIS